MRYTRQTLLPEIGPAGQNTLAQASVLIAGAGGLGSVSAMYLTAAGVGRITVVDHDEVELSNLNRQIIHSEAFLGLPKAVSAAARLRAMNTTVRVIPVQTRITPDNVDGLFSGIGIIVDGSDNYETRRILNRAALRHGLPFVYAGVKGFNATVSAFVPRATPCFECVMQRPAPTPEQPLGVIGPAPGIAGAIQAMEALKLILNIGTPLKNRMICVSGLDMQVRIVNLAKNPACAVCADLPEADGKTKES